MKMGYARVSTQEQDTAAQISALKAAGCELIFQETASSGRWERPELHRLLGQLRQDDVLVVWKLDRLSRSLKDLLLLMEKIQLAKAGLQSLTESINTTTPAGRMMMQIVGSFAEFERAMLRERTKHGLSAARAQGRIGGRRPKLKAHQEQEIVHLVHSGQKTAADAAGSLMSIRLLFPAYLHGKSLSELLANSPPSCKLLPDNLEIMELRAII